jgi:para-aminobenzoate synthetase component 1
LLAAEPFQTIRACGSQCELRCGDERRVFQDNPWQVMERLTKPLEQPSDLPFPAGGCLGFWGYDLRFFLEPRLVRRWAPGPLPDCHLGLYSSLVVFDQQLKRCWVVSTGLGPDGRRDPAQARLEAGQWRARLQSGASRPCLRSVPVPGHSNTSVASNLTRGEFVAAVRRAQDYIRQGDIYQVNLSHALSAPWHGSAWELYVRLRQCSPAPFAAFLDAGDFQLASSSPELFLRLDGAGIHTRPIKGTRPRGAGLAEDERLGRELLSSAKERAELLMITDLLRNDLGKVCEYGSVRVPELARLERFAQVQHLVSVVEGTLRKDVSHLLALAACFPGGSITGAPKFRAMQIIDELEKRPRGPYTGALGCLGFNGRSQFNILIRTGICAAGRVRFDAGAGIVADSDPEAEYEETLAKAGGFLLALGAQATTLGLGHSVRRIETCL